VYIVANTFGIPNRTARGSGVKSRLRPWKRLT